MDLEEPDSSIHLGDSCVYNIVDGDELTIEPVNVLSDTNKIVDTANNDSNENTFTVSINCDNQKTEVIMNKLNDYQNLNTNNVSKEIFRNYFFLSLIKCVFCRRRKMLRLILNEVQIKLHWPVKKINQKKSKLKMM